MKLLKQTIILTVGVLVMAAVLFSITDIGRKGNNTDSDSYDRDRCETVLDPFIEGGYMYITTVNGEAKVFVDHLAWFAFNEAEQLSICGCIMKQYRSPTVDVRMAGQNPISLVYYDIESFNEEVHLYNKENKS